MKRYIVFASLLWSLFDGKTLFATESLPGFQVSPFFNEQIRSLTLYSDVKVYINAPSAQSFDGTKRITLVFFALPNGNTTANTIGKKLKTGDDWHYDIQHIGAQTRLLRDQIKEHNIVTVYLENTQLSWPTWRTAHTNNAQLIIGLVDSIKNIFKDYTVDVVLSSHSGGGSLMFGYFNGVDSIPTAIERIAFLDSDYNYDDTYGAKLSQWLMASSGHFLSVLAYNDSVALLDGQPVVSATGGTWYRTKLMVKRLKQDFAFVDSFTTDFQIYTALNGRIKIILKENPTRAILHTVQVEKNGFVQTISSGTLHEGVGYVYYGNRAYTPWVQDDLSAPKSFGITSDTSDKLRLMIPADPSSSGTYVNLSKDGISFPDSVFVSASSPVIAGLKHDSLYYIRLNGFGVTGYPSYSEVLAGTPSTIAPKILIVNGFDRASAGNTYDFIRQHAKAFQANGALFSSATNEAVVTGLVSLSQYQTVDYILGDESTADETFSSAEQETVKTFLRHGGKLFVSGSEIGWDLDSKGTATDKDFYQQFLKAQYIADAPNNGQSGVYYAIGPVAGKIFDGLGVINFDNGTHGTINVKWPDVINGVNGGVNCLSYTGVTSNYAGVSYEGMLPGGTVSGKVVNIGVPFETMYPDSVRNLLMEKILAFFEKPMTVKRDGGIAPEDFSLYQNYPNPFNPTTVISYQLPVFSKVTLKVYDVLGREAATLVNEEQSPGRKEVLWNAKDLSSGVYIYKLQAGSFVETKRMMMLK